MHLATPSSGTLLNAALALKAADIGVAMDIRADRRPVDLVCVVRLANAVDADHVACGAGGCRIEYGLVRNCQTGSKLAAARWNIIT